MAERNEPVHRITLGKIEAAVWANRTGEDVWFNVEVKRSYKDEHGNWKSTRSFRRDDLPVAAKALEMAYEWIWRCRIKSKSPRAERVREARN